MKPTVKLVALTALLLSLTGCMRGCTSSRPPIHVVPNMDQQPKYRAQAASAFFYDGATMRAPVAGAVARGEIYAADAFLTGHDAAGVFVADLGSFDETLLPGGDALLARGQERYAIYCAPCHSERGDGKGMLWDRAQINTRDLREQRIVDMPDGEIFQTITNGLGLMQGYRYPIPPGDRWAIIAWVRQLQRESKP